MNGFYELAWAALNTSEISNYANLYECVRRIGTKITTLCIMTNKRDTLLFADTYHQSRKELLDSLRQQTVVLYENAEFRKATEKAHMVKRMLFGQIAVSGMVNYYMAVKSADGSILAFIFQKEELVNNAIKALDLGIASRNSLRKYFVQTDYTCYLNVRDEKNNFIIERGDKSYTAKTKAAPLPFPKDWSIGYYCSDKSVSVMSDQYERWAEILNRFPIFATAFLITNLITAVTAFWFITKN